MSTTAKPEPRPAYTDPTIRQLERRLEAVRTAQQAQRNTSTDRVVGAFSTVDPFGHLSIVTVTRRGAVYRMGDRDDDWSPLVPVPGTDERVMYDAVRTIEAEIAERKAALGDLA